MRIAITTPTGHVGSELVRMLVRASTRPLLLMRDPEKLAPELAPLVDVARVDQRDEISVKTATVGVDALYWVNPPAFDEPDPVAAHLAYGRTLCAAVEANGIPRIVFQSSVGAEARHGMGDIDGLGQTEEMLDRLRADVTHIRCGYFFTNLLMDVEELRAGRLPVLMDPATALPWVHPRDIAEVALGALLSPDAATARVVGAHGPRDLSFTEVAEIISETTGRRVVATRISDEELRSALAGAGMPDGAIEAIVGMSVGIRDGFVPDLPRSLATTTPSTLQEWCYGNLRPLLADG